MLSSALLTSSMPRLATRTTTLATYPLTIARSLEMRQTTPFRLPLPRRSVRESQELSTVKMRNQNSLRTRTNMNRMTIVVPLYKDHRSNLPKDFSIRSWKLPLKEMDETLGRLPLQQRSGTPSKLEIRQVHPVARQMAKPRKETRKRVPIVV